MNNNQPNIIIPKMAISDVNPLKLFIIDFSRFCKILSRTAARPKQKVLIYLFHPHPGGNSIWQYIPDKTRNVYNGGSIPDKLAHNIGGVVITARETKYKNAGEASSDFASKTNIQQDKKVSNIPNPKTGRKTLLESGYTILRRKVQMGAVDPLTDIPGL